MISRTFDYFDTEGAGSLRLRHVMDGVERIAIGTFGTVARYLFFVTDRRDCKSVGREDLEGYFHAFSRMHLQLAVNIAMLEKQHLTEASGWCNTACHTACQVGVDPAAVDAHVAQLKSQLTTLSATAVSETDEVCCAAVLWSRAGAAGAAGDVT